MVIEGKTKPVLSRMCWRGHAKSHRTRCVDKHKSVDHDSGHRVLGQESSPQSRPPRHRCQSDFKKCIHTLITEWTRGRVTERYFDDHILPALKLLTEVSVWKRSELMNWEDTCYGEIGRWNHGAHFDDCFTHIWDGFPLPVQKPTTWDGDAELVYSGDGSAVK